MQIIYNILIIKTMIFYDKISLKHRYQGVIMKDSEIKELDEDDHVFIETLKTLVSRKFSYGT